MGRHSAPADGPSAPDDAVRTSAAPRLGPVTNPIILDALASRPRTGQVPTRAAGTTGPQTVLAAPSMLAPAPPRRLARPEPAEDEWDEEEQLGPLPQPVRASVTAALTAPVSLLQPRAHHTPATVDAPGHGDAGDEPGVLPPAPAIDTRGASATGLHDRPLQISWPWFGVALVAVAVLSIVAVLPI